MISADELKFDSNGLIPAVVVDADTKKVLTVAYMNRESLKISMEKARSVRMYLRQGLTVLPRLCIRTGCPCQEKDIFPVCTSSMERL